MGYTQLTQWIEEPDPDLPSDFAMGAALLKGILDTGYKDGKWWDVTLNNGQLFLLTSFKDMLKQLQRKTLNVIAPSLFIYLDLVMLSRDQPAKIVKCIHPECGVEVDLSQKKSGACCKAHMNFECTHPKCVARAEKENWARPTHPFGTKIAGEHWQWRKQ